MEEIDDEEKEEEGKDAERTAKEEADSQRRGKGGGLDQQLYDTSSAQPTPSRAAMARRTRRRETDEGATRTGWLAAEAKFAEFRR